MAFKAEFCRAWIEAQAAPGEEYLTHLVTSTRTPLNPAQPGMKSGMTFNGTEAVRDLVQRLGLDDANKVGFGFDSTFLALSNQRLFYGTRSGFRDRPNKLLHAAPAAGSSVHWVDDETGAGNRFRHLLLDFGEGAWRTDRVGLTAAGKDMSHRSNLHEFFEVLGDRGHPIAR